MATPSSSPAKRCGIEPALFPARPRPTIGNERRRTFLIGWCVANVYVLAHNIGFAALVTIAAFVLSTHRWRTRLLALLSFRTHPLSDIIGARPGWLSIADAVFSAVLAQAGFFVGWPVGAQWLAEFRKSPV
jgi:hypothetical protein